MNVLWTAVLKPEPADYVFCCAPIIPDIARFDATFDILGVTVGSTQHLIQVAEFYEEHGLHPIVNRVFDFNDVPHAYAHLRGKTHMGKIVVQVAEQETR